MGNMSSQQKAGAGESLAKLAEKIRASHERCLKALHNSLEHAREAGTLLLEAREKVKDAGQPWLKWLQDNCTCSTSEAQRYMRIADRYGELKQLQKDLKGLSLTKALKLLSGGPEKEGKQTPQAAPELLKVSSQSEVTHLRRKAPEVRLPDGSAEQQFVTSKAKQIARQILALVKKSQLKDGDGGPAQLAVTLLEQLKDSLDASLVVAVEEPESRSEAAPANRIAGRNGRAKAPTAA
jgi:hypothetical protein